MGSDPCVWPSRYVPTAPWSSALDCGENTAEMVVAAHTVGDIDPGESLNIDFLVAFDWDQAGVQSFCVKADAPRNISFMSVTLDTSHFEMSALNDVASSNM